MRKLFIDFETWSKVNIRRGTDVYLRSAKPLLMTYAFDDEPIKLVDFTESTPPMRIPDDVILIAHNAFFDRLVLERLFQVETPIERWECTQAIALGHSLPGGLGPLCSVLGVPTDLAKDADGKRLIRKFCGPKPLEKDEEWELFKQYAIQDIAATRDCYRRLPKWNYTGHEKQVWNADQIINNRGFAVDIQFAERAVEALKNEKLTLDEQTEEQTDGALTAATQRDKLLRFLCEEQGCVLQDLRANTIEAALDDDNLGAATKDLLRIRLQSAKASPSKYKRVLECAGPDGRLRGAVQYAGANRTARWAGRMFQPQNLMRPTMKQSDINHCIELVREGDAHIVPIFANMNKALSNATRGIIIAEEGKRLLVSDYSSVEGRGLAWAAHEEWKLDAFRLKKDLYKLGYAKAFDISSDDVSKPQRQIGKVMELALGYQGGVGAFLNMAAAYGMDLEELAKTVKPSDEAIHNYAWAVEKGRDYNLPKEIYIACETLKLGYRKANPAIVQFWRDCEDAARESVRTRGASIQVGAFIFDGVSNQWLRIKLPSGRFLCYALPRLHADEKVSYMAWRNRQWKRISTYGGKIVENIIQAISRDLLAAALVRLEAAGYPVVLHVHDEILAEVEQNSDHNLEAFTSIMTADPGWAAGFPIGAEGYEVTRYEKR